MHFDFFKFFAICIIIFSLFFCVFTLAYLDMKILLKLENIEKLISNEPNNVKL